jgi:hypothetical protein
MSSNSNFAIARRRVLLAWCGWPLAALADAAPEALIAGFARWGSGEFRRFGFLIYEATLWAGGDDPREPPLALKLTYKRNIAGRDIAEASLREMRNLGVSDAARLKAWGEQLSSIFPDVRTGDSILGLHLSQGARFFHNNRDRGAIEDPAFARAFFAIWLDARTSAPELRAALLKRPAS